MKLGVACVIAALLDSPVGAHAQQGSTLATLSVENAAREFKLDKALNEISGLAPAGPTSVFAHYDEYAIIHEIDIRSGAVIRSFALGKPTAPGDFEAVAVNGGFIYLATSDGLIYEARIAKHRQRSAYNVYDTGLGGSCEIEGLAVDPKTGAFLIPCKKSSLDPGNKRLIIYKWTYADRLAPLKPWLNIALSDIVPKGGAAQNFRAADIARDPKSGNLLIVDSGGAAIVEITPGGKSAGYRKLNADKHPQAEGLAIMSDGSIVVGDEGGAKAAGKLTVYSQRH